MAVRMTGVGSFQAPLNTTTSASSGPARIFQESMWSRRRPRPPVHDLQRVSCTSGQVHFDLHALCTRSSVAHSTCFGAGLGRHRARSGHTVGEAAATCTARMQPKTHCHA